MVRVSQKKKSSHLTQLNPPPLISTRPSKTRIHSIFADWLDVHWPNRTQLSKQDDPSAASPYVQVPHRPVLSAMRDMTLVNAR